MLKVNVRNDWKEFLEQDMVGYGLQYDHSQTLENNQHRWLNAQRRISRCVKRNVRESRELDVSQHLSDYSVLKKLIEEGGDLKPYLSRAIARRNRADKNDGLLNVWGIQHLHFRPHGTKDVLFVIITDKDVFVIQSLPHDRPEAWVNPQLLQIIQDNWPDLAPPKIRGIQPEPLSIKDRVNLRANNANFLAATSDGTSYLGHAVTSSGRSFADIQDTDRMFSLLDNYQQWIEANEANFRATLHLSPSEELSIKMMFEGQGCWLCEPMRGVKFNLVQQAESA